MAGPSANEGLTEAGRPRVGPKDMPRGRCHDGGLIRDVRRHPFLHKSRRRVFTLSLGLHHLCHGRSHWSLFAEEQDLI